MTTTFMIMIPQYVATPNGEFEIAAIRARSMGGQYVNKILTAIHLRFGIRASNPPECYKGCPPTASHYLISSGGMIVIKVQEYRSQEPNREVVLTRLVAVIKDLITEQKARRPTWPTRASKEHKLASKAQKPGMKAMRGKVRSGRE